MNLYDIIHLIFLVIKKREINQSHPHVSKWCQMSKSISIIDIREEVFHSLILGSYYVVELRSKNFSKFLITPITYNSLKNLRHTPFANGEVKSSDDGFVRWCHTMSNQRLGGKRKPEGMQEKPFFFFVY